MLKIHQVNLTRSQSDQVNNAQACDQPMPDFWSAYLQMTTGNSKSAEDIGLYKHVADVSTDDLETAFAVMNRWSDVDEKMVRRLAPLHSMSVGDIVTKEDGSRWVCAGCGFEEI